MGLVTSMRSVRETVSGILKLLVVADNLVDFDGESIAHPSGTRRLPKIPACQWPTMAPTRVMASLKGGAA